MSKSNLRKEMKAMYEREFSGTPGKGESSVYIPFYAKNPKFQDLSERENMDDYQELFHVWAENLDQVFHRMQGEVWSPEGEARDYIRFLGLKHTSMSVGDVIYDWLEDKYFAVQMCGFTEIKLFRSSFWNFHK